MPETSWPTANDLSSFLLYESGLNLKIKNERDMRFGEEIDAAIERFKRASGFYPFLAEQSVRMYSPPGPNALGMTANPFGMGYGLPYVGGSRTLALDAGIVTLTSLNIGVSAGGGGHVLAAGTDFYLRPSNAPAMGLPYTSIEFRGPLSGLPSSIRIDALWGFATTINAMYRRAILADAAAAYAPQLAISKSGFLTSWSESGVTETFDKNPFAPHIATWQGQMTRALAGLRRLDTPGVF